jgi:predicted permease
MQSYVSAIDWKLGWRSLIKYPVLNLVAGIAIAFAIACAALVFEGVTQVLHPRLPLPDGNRVVGIRLWNAASSRVEGQSLYYYASWRNELRSIAELGAYSEDTYNLADSAGGGAAPARLAAITVSGFRVARVAPLFGRAFVEADGRLGAPLVTILGFKIWQQRFAGDSNIVGRSVRVGGQLHTVIGVMPEGFAYPIQYEIWTALQVAATGHLPGRGPSIRMLGRLAPSARLEDAQKELTVLGARAASGVPTGYETVRPQVMPYAKSVVYVPTDAGVGFRSANLATVLLLVLACGNVALLVFARAATRDTEFVVRQALGATRRRIIAQLFVESLVLGTIAAAIGLAVASLAMKWAFALVQTAVMLPPFWFRDTLSWTTLAYGVVLAVLSAAITGALPAAKMTRDLGVQLRGSAAGAGGLRLGRALGVVMTAQVTVAVLFPVSTYYLRRDVLAYRSLDLGYPVDEYVAARLGIDAAFQTASTSPGIDSATAASFSRTLRHRAEEQSGVTAVTFASALPGMWHPRVRIEIDAAGTLLPDTLFKGGVTVASVDVNYFEAMQAHLRLGRGFQAADLLSRAGAVVVNESFVTYRLQGRNPIGWRLRYPNPDEPGARRRPDQEPGPWHEIVGVVNDLAMTTGGDPRPYPGAGIYHPMEPGLRTPVYMAVHVKGRGETFVEQLYAAATSVDPRLRVEGVFRPRDIGQGELVLPIALFRLSIVLSAMALLISSAALYAVTSFTVRRRTQEIGIRVALGSDSQQVLALILRRPFLQVASGVLVGTVATLAYAIGSGITASILLAVLTYGTLMLVVCMVGCAAPAIRALRIKPMQALRTE